MAAASSITCQAPGAAHVRSGGPGRKRSVVRRGTVPERRGRGGSGPWCGAGVRHTAMRRSAVLAPAGAPVIRPAPSAATDNRRGPSAPDRRAERPQPQHARDCGSRRNTAPRRWTTWKRSAPKRRRLSASPSISARPTREGELVNWVQECRGRAAGIIINPAGYTHTSIALMDALLAVDLPVIEVHITNIHRREEFRQHSFVSKAATGVIAGLGVGGYALALRAMAERVAPGSPARWRRRRSPHGRGRMTSGIQFDPEAIRALAQILKDTDLSEIELVEKDSRIRVARALPAARPAATRWPAGMVPAGSPARRRLPVEATPAAAVARGDAVERRSGDGDALRRVSAAEGWTRSTRG